MRGHKKNHNFIIDYIKSCFKQNKLTAHDICLSAKNRIDFIDEKIKEVEELKKEKKLLVDVLDHFHYKNDQFDKLELQFFSIENKNIAIKICQTIPNEIITNDEYEIFCLKQLVYFKVLECFNGIFYPSINYDKFINWSSCENKKS